jgi:hypothetical protein
MITADQLVAHAVGDYILQSDWMATEKTKQNAAAATHALTYTLPFLFLTRSHCSIARDPNVALRYRSLAPCSLCSVGEELARAQQAVGRMRRYWLPVRPPCVAYGVAVNYRGQHIARDLQWNCSSELLIVDEHRIAEEQVWRAEQSFVEAETMTTPQWSRTFLRSSRPQQLLMVTPEGQIVSRIIGPFDIEFSSSVTRQIGPSDGKQARYEISICWRISSLTISSPSQADAERQT